MAVKQSVIKANKCMYIGIEIFICCYNLSKTYHIYAAPQLVATLRVATAPIFEIKVIVATAFNQVNMVC